MPRNEPGRPVLLVGNHQLYGACVLCVYTYMNVYIYIHLHIYVYIHQTPPPQNAPTQRTGIDLGLIVREFLQEREMLVRGLAHPALFQVGR